MREQSKGNPPRKRVSFRQPILTVCRHVAEVPSKRRSRDRLYGSPPSVSRITGHIQNGHAGPFFEQLARQFPSIHVRHDHVRDHSVDGAVHGRAMPQLPPGRWPPPVRGIRDDRARREPSGGASAASSVTRASFITRRTRQPPPRSTNLRSPVGPTRGRGPP